MTDIYNILQEFQAKELRNRCSNLSPVVNTRRGGAGRLLSKRQFPVVLTFVDTDVLLLLLLLLLLLFLFAFAFIHCNLKFKFQKSLLINIGFIWAVFFPEDWGTPSIQNVTALRIFRIIHTPFHWPRNSRNGIFVPILLTKVSGFISVVSNLRSYFVTKSKTLANSRQLMFF